MNIFFGVNINVRIIATTPRTKAFIPVNALKKAETNKAIDMYMPVENGPTRKLQKKSLKCFRQRILFQPLKETPHF